MKHIERALYETFEIKKKNERIAKIFRNSILFSIIFHFFFTQIRFLRHIFINRINIKSI